MLFLKYILALSCVALITMGLSRLKKALLRYCQQLKEPPSQP